MREPSQRDINAFVVLAIAAMAAVYAASWSCYTSGADEELVSAHDVDRSDGSRAGEARWEASRARARRSAAYRTADSNDERLRGAEQFRQITYSILVDRPPEGLWRIAISILEDHNGEGIYSKEVPIESWGTAIPFRLPRLRDDYLGQIVNVRLTSPAGGRFDLIAARERVHSRNEEESVPSFVIDARGRQWIAARALHHDRSVASGAELVELTMEGDTPHVDDRPKFADRDGRILISRKPNSEFAIVAVAAKTKPRMIRVASAASNFVDLGQVVLDAASRINGRVRVGNVPAEGVTLRLHRPSIASKKQDRLPTGCVATAMIDGQVQMVDQIYRSGDGWFEFCGERDEEYELVLEATKNRQGVHPDVHGRVVSRVSAPAWDVDIDIDLNRIDLSIENEPAGLRGCQISLVGPSPGRSPMAFTFGSDPFDTMPLFFSPFDDDRSGGPEAPQRARFYVQPSTPYTLRVTRRDGATWSGTISSGPGERYTMLPIRLDPARRRDLLVRIANDPGHSVQSLDAEVSRTPVGVESDQRHPLSQRVRRHLERAVGEPTDDGRFLLRHAVIVEGRIQGTLYAWGRRPTENMWLPTNFSVEVSENHEGPAEIELTLLRGGQVVIDAVSESGTPLTAGIRFFDNRNVPIVAPHGFPIAAFENTPKNGIVSYVIDYDVEVAQSSFIPDPVVPCVHVLPQGHYIAEITFDDFKVRRVPFTVEPERLTRCRVGKE